MNLKYFFLTSLFLASVNLAKAEEAFCPGGSQPDPNVLFCDSFETQGQTSSDIDKSRYFDFDDNNGDVIRDATEFAEGVHSLRVHWQKDEDAAGAFQLNFGRNPLGSNIAPTEDFREIFWRMYVKLPTGFQGFPDKLTRLTSFANTNWAQAMVAHLWANEYDKQYLMLEPVSGIKNNQLATTKWNDFANFTWLGGVTSETSFPKGRWVCVEGHVRLNDAGQTNGLFEMYLDDQLNLTKSNIDWVGSWSEYSLNSILFSNYWNGGSPADQYRYIDAIVVSKARIGCISNVQPNPPTNVDVN